MRRIGGLFACVLALATTAKPGEDAGETLVRRAREALPKVIDDAAKPAAGKEVNVVVLVEKSLDLAATSRTLGDLDQSRRALNQAIAVADGIKPEEMIPDLGEALFEPIALTQAKFGEKAAALENFRKVVRFVESKPILQLVLDEDWDDLVEKAILTFGPQDAKDVMDAYRRFLKRAYSTADPDSRLFSLLVFQKDFAAVSKTFAELVEKPKGNLTRRTNARMFVTLLGYHSQRPTRDVSLALSRDEEPVVRALLLKEIKPILFEIRDAAQRFHELAGLALAQNHAGGFDDAWETLEAIDPNQVDPGSERNPLYSALSKTYSNLATEQFKRGDVSGARKAVRRAVETAMKIDSEGDSRLGQAVEAAVLTHDRDAALIVLKLLAKDLNLFPAIGFNRFEGIAKLIPENDPTVSKTREKLFRFAMRSAREDVEFFLARPDDPENDPYGREKLFEAVGDLADISLRRGDREAADKAIDELAEFLRDPARRYLAKLRATANDPRGALDLIRAIKDEAVARQATVDAASAWIDQNKSK